MIKFKERETATLFPRIFTVKLISTDTFIVRAKLHSSLTIFIVKEK